MVVISDLRMFWQVANTMLASLRRLDGHILRSATIFSEAARLLARGSTSRAVTGNSLGSVGSSADVGSSNGSPDWRRRACARTEVPPSAI